MLRLQPLSGKKEEKEGKRDLPPGTYFVQITVPSSTWLTEERGTYTSETRC